MEVPSGENEAVMSKPLESMTPEQRLDFLKTQKGIELKVVCFTVCLYPIIQGLKRMKVVFGAAFEALWFKRWSDTENIAIIWRGICQNIHSIKGENSSQWSLWLVIEESRGGGRWCQEKIQTVNTWGAGGSGTAIRWFWNHRERRWSSRWIRCQSGWYSKVEGGIIAEVLCTERGARTVGKDGCQGIYNSIYNGMIQSDRNNFIFIGVLTDLQPA